MTAFAQTANPARRGTSAGIGWLPVLAIVLAGGLAIRLVIAFVVAPGQGLSGDLGLFQQWALAMVRVGPGGFYGAAASANYPPLYMLVLWVVGSVGDLVAGPLGVTSDRAVLLLLKVPAIASDMLIALLLFWAGRRWFGAWQGVAAAALFLFIPVTWYDSALWGQVDAVATLVMVAGLILLVEGWSEPAAALAVLGVLTKPQDLVFLVVLVPVLGRRHLLRQGSGPVPHLGRALVRVDGALDGLFTRQQGPIRLVSSAFAAAIVGILVIVPFDLWRFAPGSLADVPVIGQAAGLVGLMQSTAEQFSVLTANAFNAWALVGPQSLANAATAGGSVQWTDDGTIVVAGLSAVTIGAGLFAAAALLVALGLLRRDGPFAILLGFTVVAFAFYALPTRVHERYLFPVFASGALLAAGSLAWGAWYVVLGLLNVVNLHAVLAGLTGGFGRGGAAGARGGGPGGGGGFGGPGRGFGGGGFGGPGGGFGGLGLGNLPFGDLARSEPVIVAVALGQTLLFVLAVVAWLIYVIRPVRSAVVPSTSTASGNPFVTNAGASAGG
jgi:hypothetical protein